VLLPNVAAGERSQALKEQFPELFQDYKHK